MSLAVDLCCGMGGWTHGLMHAGWQVVGFDLFPHPDYPSQLVRQDIRTITGLQFRGKVKLIVASPPCNEYTMFYGLGHVKPHTPSTELFRHCERIGREAECPIIIENVRDAQPWVGPARAHYASFYLWGNVPALLPWVPRRRFKERHSSAAKDLRAQIPFELALHIGKCFAP